MTHNQRAKDGMKSNAWLVPVDLINIAPFTLPLLQIISLKAAYLMHNKLQLDAHLWHIPHMQDNLYRHDKLLFLIGY
ncbi:unnamed protein product [Haemonchus placei]|uniref:Uncharacterized protein n=1 Tax=Haemonchus placei TaxID=6290 RepID=A0A0N4WXM3_HAEPC|nr:unnamed protein product [Haemonchus placei]